MRVYLLLFFLLGPFSAFALCVNVDHATLRTGPGKDFKPTWTVGRFMPLKKLAQKGGWYKVEDLDGEVRWISANMVVDSSSCVVVKAKFANLRQGPGTQSPLGECRLADRYTPFRKLDGQGDWIQVEDDYNQKYWVAASAVWTPINHMNITF